MSLRIWLPLDGDLHNLGCTDVTIINNGTTINTNGKIGNCYYFNASSYLYENTYNWTNFNTSQFSLCCWYKLPSPVASGNSLIICIGTSSGWNNIRIGLLRRTSSGYPMFSVSDGSSAVSYNCTATTFSLDTWNHIACTYDNGTMKIYLNGTLNKTYTTTIAPVLNSSLHLGIGAASNGAEKLTGYLNDVRIYDHCLSAAEVREIALGLVLHYKLDNTCAFTDLIARNVNVTAYNNHGNTNNPTTITYLSTHYYGDRIIQYSATPTENAISSILSSLSSHGIYNWHQTFKANTKYVFWIYYKPISHPDTRCGGTASNIGGWTEIPPVEVGDGWYRVGLYRNGTVTSDKSDNIFVSYKTPSAQVGDTIIILFAAPHLIEGMMEIPPYDYSSDIIEDSSGYNHNGTIVGTTISIISNCPRYSRAISMNNTSTTNHIESKEDITISDNMTISCWVKASLTKNLVIFTTDTILFGILNQLGYVKTTGSSPGYQLSSYFISNEWNHICVVRSAENYTLYVNGEAPPRNGGSNYYLHNISKLWLLNRSYNSSYGADASISDFRIYCTPLLDTDIKLLYNVSMKVDKLGSTHSFEFIELQSNIIFPIELSRSNLEFTNGLSRYTQANCQVTLTDLGYRIYRPPNLTTANDGNTMWGGLLINNLTSRVILPYNATQDNIFNLLKNHTYMFAFHAKGQSSNSPSLIVESNMGWDRIAGVGPNPTYIKSRTIPPDFNGEQDCYIIFKIEDDIVKVATENKSSYIQGNSYLSYRDLCLNYNYTSTGTLGTDLYLTNFRLYDITTAMAKITKQGQAKFDDFVEQLSKTQVRRNSELLSSQFIER